MKKIKGLVGNATWKVSLIVMLLPAFFLSLQAQEISLGKLQKDLYYLASDSMKGRKPGSIEGQLSAMYIRKQFEKSGLTLLADRGFQKFDVVFKVKLGKMNEFSFLDFIGSPGNDYSPLSFSENGRLDASGAFAGYGFNIREDSLIWNDYQDLDVKGKWIMMLRGDPEPDKAGSKFLLYSEERSKVLLAKDKGALGVLFVTGTNMDKKDTLIPMLYDKSGATAGIPVLNVRRSVADLLLKPTGRNIGELEKTLNESRKPVSFSIPVTVKATIQVSKEKAMTENIIGMIEGTDPVLKNQYIVIGAHYDHLGMGGSGSGSRAPDTVAVHNGADDNASGVAGIIALAENLVKAEKKPRRSLIFVAFTGEESGLLGSGYFIKNCPVDAKNIKTMINLDMIGRLLPDSGSVMISGTGTALEAMEIIEKYSKDLPFALKFSPEGFGASDHSSFYVENIPVFFFTTGAHDDYHTPADDREKINYAGEKQVLDFVSEMITDIANRENPLTFQEAGPKGNQNRSQKFKVVLGILPDFAGTENKGLRIDGVKKDGPASKGGLLKGDIITAVNGLVVTNIYEYMDRLKTLEPGQTVNVDLLRNGKKMILLIQL